MAATINAGLHLSYPGRDQWPLPPSRRRCRAGRLAAVLLIAAFIQDYFGWGGKNGPVNPTQDLNCPPDGHD